MEASTVARLREGLKQLMMGGPDGITACPVTPGDWSRWTAKLACADDGSAIAGLEVHLALRYPYEEQSAGPPSPEAQSPEAQPPTEDGTAGACEPAPPSGLPRVRVVRPAGLFHPNVDPSTGELSARALDRRCSAVDLVGAQLLAIGELLRRPAFDVRPANEEAAAAWFGERAALRARLRVRAGQRGSPEQVTPAPLMRRLTN